MKGVHPSVCTHHIYIKEGCRPVREPQRRMNPALKDIVKEELQKLLDGGFIYPISNSEWVSCLVLVPKKNGNWRICFDYRELNKATKKDHFPLPFVDQVLDGLAGKKFFSFLDGFNGYNQIQICLEDQDKTTFTYPWGTFAYRVLPFGLCNAPTTFQRVVLSIFAELVHDVVEIYMDYFTPYGCDFQESMTNLGKVLHKFIEMNLSLSPENTVPTKIAFQRNEQDSQKECPLHLDWGNLFKLGPDQILRKCVREVEVFDILLTCHDGPCGGHFVAKRTTFKVLQARYYWPTLHQDVKSYISQCDRCQRIGEPTTRDEIPLQPQVTLEPFDKWGMDFIEPINPPSKKKQHIIVCTNYLTKWAETKAIKAATEEKVAEFLRENIFYKFGYPRELVRDQGNQFTSSMIEELFSHHKIKHRTSTPYHPQANGQVEVTNRAVENILTKVVSSSRKD
eukprot:PITA_32975